MASKKIRAITKFVVIKVIQFKVTISIIYLLFIVANQNIK
jgi:hypothetical protein